MMEGNARSRERETDYVRDDDKNKLTVDIYGQQYRMVGKASATHLHSVANYVDEKMRYIAGGNPRLDTAKLAVLAAINITDEYFRLKEEYEELIRILENEEKQNE
jgi:cell division protein ZapA